ncbi:NFACT RNA binding domain-containing protein [Methanogenium cariaci]|uniref:NFACT RNA binding domain-containing protein n=1 Tax=Methanogenium cariaci TaxID=2197 RepID=UPI000AFBFD00|nr:NFACT RNA binding domain-containing protein [Methanogenium cariaci]
MHGGSVIIVKGDTEKNDEVAQFAVSYSNAWKNGNLTADVYAASPSQVSKTPETGEYVSRGSFIVRGGERTYTRNVGLGVAIGLQVTPELGVIGGPIDAVKSRQNIMSSFVRDAMSPMTWPKRSSGYSGINMGMNGSR